MQQRDFSKNHGSQLHFAVERLNSPLHHAAVRCKFRLQYQVGVKSTIFAEISTLQGAA
jgi:hypothetical protein